MVYPTFVQKLGAAMSYETVHAFQPDTFHIARGEVTALMGRNGDGTFRAFVGGLFEMTISSLFALFFFDDSSQNEHVFSYKLNSICCYSFIISNADCCCYSF